MRSGVVNTFGVISRGMNVNVGGLSVGRVGVRGAPHYAGALRDSRGGQVDGSGPEQKKGRVREEGQDSHSK